jgi:hypothetical protein
MQIMAAIADGTAQLDDADQVARGIAEGSREPRPAAQSAPGRWNVGLVGVADRDQRISPVGDVPATTLVLSYPRRSVEGITNTGRNHGNTGSKNVRGSTRNRGA